MYLIDFEKMSDEDAAKAFIEMCQHFLVPFSKLGYLSVYDNDPNDPERDYQKMMLDVNSNITQLFDIESDSEIDLVDFAKIFRRYPDISVERILTTNLNLEGNDIYELECFLNIYCKILSNMSDSLKSILNKLHDMRELDELAERMRMERD